MWKPANVDGCNFRRLGSSFRCSGQDQPSTAKPRRSAWPDTLEGTRANHDSLRAFSHPGRRETRPVSSELPTNAFATRVKHGVSRIGDRAYWSCLASRWIRRRGCRKVCFYSCLRSKTVYGDDGKVPDKPGLCSPRPTLVRRQLQSAVTSLSTRPPPRSLRPSIRKRNATAMRRNAAVIPSVP